MTKKTPHEPDADVMSAEEVWEDAQRLEKLLKKNLATASTSGLQRFPLILVLLSLDNLNREELTLLRRSVEQRLSEAA